MSIVSVSVLILVSMGVIIAILLGIASKVFHVEVDPKIQEIDNLLPGLNCGACGYPGCFAYAKAIITENAVYTKCPIGGAKVKEAITKLM